ncbi:MAG TPA: biotin/lipoyl-containing protein, partial [Acetobacteraceae bacterium]|nr:biotin/lipoyl-containing protein [Acetobacteraceae bacterium]
MATDIKVPTLGESVSSATVARWLKKAGENVARDEPVVELETDKVTVEVPAPGPGVLASIQAEEGAEVAVGAVLGTLDSDGAAQKPSSGKSPAPAAMPSAGVNPPPRPLGP